MICASFQAFVPTWSNNSSGVTEMEASDACGKHLFGAPVTLTCADYNLIGQLISTAFDFCKDDIQVSYSLNDSCKSEVYLSFLLAL